MVDRVQPLYESFRLGTVLFRNCLEGVDDSVGRKRLTDNTNHLLFLGCHLVDERYFIAQLMGGTYVPPFPELAEVGSVDDFPDDPPSIKRVLTLWNKISAELLPRFESLGEAELSSPSPIPVYPADAPGTIWMALSFLMHHEGYHIGQMALLRKGLGLPAMRYD